MSTFGEDAQAAITGMDPGFPHETGMPVREECARSRREDTQRPGALRKALPDDHGHQSVRLATAHGTLPHVGLLGPGELTPPMRPGLGFWPTGGHDCSVADLALARPGQGLGGRIRRARSTPSTADW
jgi:hypothetical protein